jgi:hypothetical protein
MLGATYGSWPVVARRILGMDGDDFGRVGSPCPPLMAIKPRQKHDLSEHFTLTNIISAYPVKRQGVRAYTYTISNVDIFYTEREKSAKARHGTARHGTARHGKIYSIYQQTTEKHQQTGTHHAYTCCVIIMTNRIAST